MIEQPDLDGRDPAELTDIEKLAWIGRVAELVRERDQLREVNADILRATAADRAELTELREMKQRAREVARGEDPRYIGSRPAARYILGES